MKIGIPDLSKEKRQMWIKALNELLSYYKGENEGMAGCPLCDVSAMMFTEIHSTCSENKYCVWFWLTGKSCNACSKEKFGRFAWSLRTSLDPEWIKLRISQIPGWIKELEEGL